MILDPIATIAIRPAWEPCIGGYANLEGLRVLVVGRRPEGLYRVDTGNGERPVIFGGWLTPDEDTDWPAAGGRE